MVDATATMVETNLDFRDSAFRGTSKSPKYDTHGKFEDNGNKSHASMIIAQISLTLLEGEHNSCHPPV